MLTSVTAAGNKVTMNFSKPAEPYFYNFANQVAIVPEHIFSKLANPVTDPDTRPRSAPARTR